LDVRKVRQNALRKIGGGGGGGEKGLAKKQTKGRKGGKRRFHGGMSGKKKLSERVSSVVRFRTKKMRDYGWFQRLGGGGALLTKDRTTGMLGLSKGGKWAGAKKSWCGIHSVGLVQESKGEIGSSHPENQKKKTAKKTFGGGGDDEAALCQRKGGGKRNPKFPGKSGWQARRRKAGGKGGEPERHLPGKQTKRQYWKKPRVYQVWLPRL